jgi:hypothetical protein
VAPCGESAERPFAAHCDQLKCQAPLDARRVPVRALRTAADIEASTGGFTLALLHADALRVDTSDGESTVVLLCRASRLLMGASGEGSRDGLMSDKLRAASRWKCGGQRRSGVTTSL